MALYRVGGATGLEFRGSPSQNGIERALQREDLLAHGIKFHGRQTTLDDARAEAIVCYDCENQLVHASRRGIEMKYKSYKSYKTIELENVLILATLVHRKS